jgi:hypothetical protein
MTMPKINKNILLVGALVIVAAVAYFTFFRADNTANDLTSVEVNQNLGVGQELLIELNRLKALRAINKDIFTDPVFVTLEDYTEPVVPQPSGRTNPFAPIGSE